MSYCYIWNTCVAYILFLGIIWNSNLLQHFQVLIHFQSIGQCSGSRLFNFILFKTVKESMCTCTVELVNGIVRHSVYNSLQFFQWLVMLQYSCQSYSSKCSETIVSEAEVADINHLSWINIKLTNSAFLLLQQWQPVIPVWGSLGNYFHVTKIKTSYCKSRIFFQALKFREINLGDKIFLNPDIFCMHMRDSGAD